MLFFITFGFYFIGYGAYAYGYLTFGLSFLFLFVAFFLLERFLRDRKAKPHRFKWMTSFSAYLSEKGNRYRLLFACLGVLLLLIFFGRFYFWKGSGVFVNDAGKDVRLSYYDYLHLESILICDRNSFSLRNLNRFEQVVGTLSNDLWVGATVLTLVSAFYLKENSLFARRYIGGPIAFLLTLFFPVTLKGIVGFETTSYRLFFMSVELGIMDFYYFHSYFEKGSFTFKRRQICTLISLLIPFLITAMSSYTPSLLFGRTIFGLPNPHEPTDLSHRLLIYMSFLLPIIYFLCLYPLSKSDRRGMLLQVSLGTFFGYISINRYDIWGHFSSWPMHLCNTAMYTMPLTLLFLSYGLYYFTFFINVLGAFLALLMPNFSESLAVFNPTVVEFYINHLHAFFMPVLIMLLGVYKRPKMKYFVYSQIGFLCYFVLVMFINVDLTAHGDPTDFFFINSDFVAKKLGKWAQDLFEITASFERNGLTYTVHYLYDIAYYGVYIVLAFGMWFVYELLFKGVDELLAIRLAKEKALTRVAESRKALKAEGGTAMGEGKASLVINGLYKKYRGNESYAVTDFSASLEGGKIYGFLGKNGAGKSTIIKSIVGIHGFDEGTIEVCGHNVIAEPLEAKKDIGFVPDNYALYENLTGRQYINYIADLYGVDKETRKKKEEELVSRLELGFRYDKPMKSYSHGMKQKITIIAALIHNPKVWILDEPMTGLDPNSIYQIKECMKEHAKRGNLVFFSSHIIDVVKNLCDEVIIIKRGVLIRRIDLNAHPEEREKLEETFLTLTSDSEEEAATLIGEERLLKGDKA